MANQLEICNLALSQVKGGFIESLTESSREAEIINRIYDLARDSTLTDVAPRFARKQVALALSTDTVTGWSFVYAYPADCLDAIEIYNEASAKDEDKIPFEIAAGSALNTKVILTEQELAELIYTAKVTNTSVYDNLFTEALAWKLASYLAMPLKGDDKLRAQTGQAYSIAVGIAKSKTKNEGWREADTSNAFTKAR